MKLCEALLDLNKETIGGLYGKYKWSLNLADSGLQSSFYYFLPEYYEAETQRYIMQFVKPGMVTMDVGAHLGLFTILLAHQTGTKGFVYSFEPEVKNFTALSYNLTLNHMTWVHPFRMALSNKTGEDTLLINESDASHALGNALGAHVRRSDVSRQVVQTISLDDFVRREGVDKIDLIKIDAEQSEHLILAGAERYLAKGLISQVICEIHSTSKQHGAGKDSVRKVLYAHGYRSFVLNPMLAKKKFLAEVLPNEPVYGLQNLLFRK